MGSSSRAIPDSRGQYDFPKAAYREIAGKDWLVGREEHVLEEINVAKACATSVKSWYTYQHPHEISK